VVSNRSNCTGKYKTNFYGHFLFGAACHPAMDPPSTPLPGFGWIFFFYRGDPLAGLGIQIKIVPIGNKKKTRLGSWK
jgi:hypothetical protein